MKFTVDSYLEYFLTLLGWVINNGIFGVLIQTGIFLIPLLFILVRTFLEVKKQGDDEGNKGELLMRWLGIAYLPAMLAIILMMAPVIPISLEKISLNTQQSTVCGYSVPKQPKDTGYGSMASELGGQTARVPIWWGLFHRLNKGITHAFISVIPCKPDLRQVRFEVQHEKINNPILLTEIKHFVEQCYVPAQARLKESQLSLTPAQVQDTDWLGGHILITNSELYPRYRAKQPHRLWAYDAQRDAGLPNNGEGGFPNCAQWWNDADVGLKNRLLADVMQNFSAQVIGFFKSKEYTDEAVLRAILRPENVNVSEGKVYPGYSGNVDTTAMNVINSVASAAGMAVGSVAAFPGFDAVRQALPMVQAFILMTVIILTPVVIVLSAYSLKTIVTLTIVNFALIMLSFWWELARWLDSWLLDALYNSSTHNSLNVHFLSNTRDDIVVNFVMGSLFLVLPALWVGALSWAGMSIGNIANALASGSSTSQQAGQQGGAIATKVFNKLKEYFQGKGK
ncbi:TraG-like protein, N-terminal region [Pasteurella testudinis DSM 23072]|uniref:TraG-like protein, N-terminal region n=1 Tax=Pasteurella testudinis DSM 23072 TaxID=1122938 RepID=A0A1W1UW07_9PAST|nr:conjugal transfer protein TraG N-terminal domain-containing protein [Pasteurella testudinis]SMB85216.1 TraG-like protein, N-terminal region [Pasteurella testudinis DSM 23072]SUB52136.1 TraG-like domain-containing protein [Pasteurella testudinis]